jgi:hypothetical protein
MKAIKMFGLGAVALLTLTILIPVTSARATYPIDSTIKSITRIERDQYGRISRVVVGHFDNGHITGMETWIYIYDDQPGGGPGPLISIEHHVDF